MFIMFKNILLSLVLCTFEHFEHGHVLGMIGHFDTCALMLYRHFCCLQMLWGAVQFVQMFKRGSHPSSFEHSEHFEQGPGAD